MIFSLTMFDFDGVIKERGAARIDSETSIFPNVLHLQVVQLQIRPHHLHVLRLHHGVTVL